MSTDTANTINLPAVRPAKTEASYSNTVNLGGGSVAIRLNSRGYFTGIVRTPRGTEVTRVDGDTEANVIDQANSALAERAAANAAKREAQKAKALREQRSETDPLWAWQIANGQPVRVLVRAKHSLSNDILVTLPNGSADKIRPSSLYASEEAARRVIDARDVVARLAEVRDAIGVDARKTHSVYAMTDDDQILAASYDPATATWSVIYEGEAYLAPTIDRLTKDVQVAALHRAGLTHAVVRLLKSDTTVIIPVTEWVESRNFDRRLVRSVEEGQAWIDANDAVDEAQARARIIANEALFDEGLIR